MYRRVNQYIGGYACVDVYPESLFKNKVNYLWLRAHVFGALDKHYFGLLMEKT